MQPATRLTAVCVLLTSLSTSSIAMSKNEAVTTPNEQTITGSLNPTTMMMQAATTVVSKEYGPYASTALGWVFSAMGLTPNPNQQIINKLNEIEGQLTQIDTELNTIEASIVNVYKQLLDNDAQQMLTILNTQVAIIEPQWQVYTALISNKSISPSQLDDTSNIIIKNVPQALDAIDNILTSNGAGSDGLIEAYAKVLSDKYTTPVLGDQEYYENLHGIIAYYNKWRLRATLLMTEAYHFKAISAAPKGVTLQEVCQPGHITGQVDFYCQQASHYANRYYQPSNANPNAGVMKQLQIAGASVSDSNAVSLSVPTSSGGVPGVNVWLWTLNPEINYQFPPLPLPNGSLVWYKWSDTKFANNDPESSYMPPTLNYQGFSNWRFAQDSDVSALFSSINASGTVGDSLKTHFPNIVAAASTSYIMVTTDLDGNGTIGYRRTNVPELGPGGQHWVAYLALNNPVSNMFVYGSMAPGGLGTCSQVSLQEVANLVPYCASPAFCTPCENYNYQGSALYWGPSTQNINDTNLHGPAWAVTDATGCPAGQSATNSAGWLKPCGDDWVNTRYSAYLPKKL